jgi:hypothetical protein
VQPQDNNSIASGLIKLSLPVLLVGLFFYLDVNNISFDELMLRVGTYFTKSTWNWLPLLLVLYGILIAVKVRRVVNKQKLADPKIFDNPYFRIILLVGVIIISLLAWYFINKIYSFYSPRFMLE